MPERRTGDYRCERLDACAPNHPHTAAQAGGQARERSWLGQPECHINQQDTEQSLRSAA
jgi:hypothetical protein